MLQWTIPLMQKVDFAPISQIAQVRYAMDCMGNSPEFQDGIARDGQKGREAQSERNCMGATMPATYTDAIAEVLTDDFKTTEAVEGDRIRAARRRVAEGWYDRDELLETVLEAILQDVAPRR